MQEIKNDIPKRPGVTDEMILAAARKVAEQITSGEEFSVDACTIAGHYRYPMDGYELARELDLYAGWEITASDVEELDAMDHHIERSRRQAEFHWVRDHDIKPGLVKGTAIKEGIISGVCEHSPAYYKVKEYGCVRDGRHLLIRFEDAMAIENPAE